MAILSSSLSSCGPIVENARAKAFASSLASIDGILSQARSAGLDASARKKLAAAFSRAYSSARGDADWLGVAKRGRAAAAAGDSGRWIAASERALAARPASEPIAAAAAQAYLRNGAPAKALSLFGKVLQPDARPLLWAEAFVAACEGAPAGSPPAATSADYARLAEATGEGKAYLGAAALSLKSGDKHAAAAWLEKATAAGSRPSPELLWDCGLYAELSSLPDLGASAPELELMGDAAWLAGSRDQALRRWERSASFEPRRSYRVYEKLALASDADAAASYWRRLSAAFLSGPASGERDGATAAYAAYLARAGRDAEALALLKGFAGATAGRLALLDLAIRSRAMPEGRIAAQYEALAAERPDDPEVALAALKALSIRGLFGEAAVLRESERERGLELGFGWYYDAQSLAARGYYAKAMETIQSAGAKGAQARFALGSLYGALGDSGSAAKSYAAAAEAAVDLRDRAASYKALGRVLGQGGDGEGAARAFSAALAADPLDPEAAMLARRSGR